MSKSTLSERPLQAGPVAPRTERANHSNSKGPDGRYFEHRFLDGRSTVRRPNGRPVGRCIRLLWQIIERYCGHDKPFCLANADTLAAVYGTERSALFAMLEQMESLGIIRRVFADGIHGSRNPKLIGVIVLVRLNSRDVVPTAEMIPALEARIKEAREAFRRSRQASGSPQAPVRFSGRAPSDFQDGPRPIFRTIEPEELEPQESEPSSSSASPAPACEARDQDDDDVSRFPGEEPETAMASPIAETNPEPASAAAEAPNGAAEHHAAQLAAAAELARVVADALGLADAEQPAAVVIATAEKLLPKRAAEVRADIQRIEAMTLAKVRAIGVERPPRCGRWCFWRSSERRSSSPKASSPCGFPRWPSTSSSKGFPPRSKPM